MKIGLISDTHDNVSAIRAAIDVFRSHRVKHMLHLGDFVAPFAVRELLKANLPVNAVFGNCDGEMGGILKLLENRIQRVPYLLPLPGAKDVQVLLAHNLEQVSADLRSKAAVLLHGHTHKAKIEHSGSTVIINPGECCGWVTGRKSVAVLDSKTLEAEILYLE
jgi:hypothetical protein